MRVIVTGAAGFVGAALVRGLVRRGHQVIAASRAPLPPSIEAIARTRILPDLGSIAMTQPDLSGADALVHAAGLAHLPEGGDEAELHRINAGGAERLACAAAEAGLSRFVLISSLRAITGPSAATALSETDPPAPSDAYGRSKLASETLVATTFPHAVILRPPVIHGAGAKGNMARLQRLASLPIPLPLGGLEGRRSILSDANLASAVDFVLSEPASAGGCFHLSDGETLTVPEILSAMREAVGRRAWLLPMSRGFTRFALGLAARRSLQQLTENLVVDDRALRSLGWRPAEPSSEGLGRLMRDPSGQTRL